MTFDYNTWRGDSITASNQPASGLDDALFRLEMWRSNLRGDEPMVELHSLPGIEIVGTEKDALDSQPTEARHLLTQADSNSPDYKVEARDQGHVPDALEAKLGLMLSEGTLDWNSPEGRFLSRSLQAAYRNGGVDGIHELVNGINKWLEGTGRTFSMDVTTPPHRDHHPGRYNWELMQATFSLTGPGNQQIGGPQPLFLMRDTQGDRDA